MEEWNGLFAKHGLKLNFRLHDVANSGMVVGEAESAILVSKVEYADDAALVDENAALVSTRITALATASDWLHDGC